MDGSKINRFGSVLILLVISVCSSASLESVSAQRRLNATSPPAPALSYHDLASLSRGDKPSMIERTIGAIFSKVALGSPPKSIDKALEELERTTTTEKPKNVTNNNILPKLVTPKIGFDLNKWGFAGFKPREDPFQEPNIVTNSERTKETTPIEVFTVIVTEPATRKAEAEDNLQIRINVPKEIESPETTPTPNNTYPDLVTDEIPQKPIIANVPVATWADDNAQRELAWRVHIYGTTALYLLVAIYAVTSLVQLAASISVRLVPRMASATILAFVALVPLLRVAHLLHDPYASDRLLHPAAALVLFDFAFPCLSSAHVILLLSMLKAADLEVLPRKLQQLRTSIVIISLHLLLTVSVDVAAGYTTIGSLHLASQAAFVLWTLTLCLGYFAAFGPVSKAARGIQVEMRRAVTVSLHITSPKVPQRLPRPTLHLASRITLCASVSCLFVGALQLYSMFGTFGIPWNKPESIMNSTRFWSWWTFQFLARLFEISACLIMAVVASMPQILTSKSKLGSAAQTVGWAASQKGDGLSTVSPDRCPTKPLTLDDGQYPVVCGNSHQPKNYCYQQKPNEAYSGLSITGDALMSLNGQIPHLKRITLSSENEAYSKSRPASVLYNDGGFSRGRELYDQPDKPSYETIDEMRGERTLCTLQTGRLLNECRSCEPKYNGAPAGNYGYSCQKPLGAQDRCPRNSHEKAIMENYVKLLLASRGENRSQDTLAPTDDLNPCLYNAQCPASTCSSESAANSFDMRLYGCPCPVYNHYHPLPKNGDAGLRPTLRRSPVFRPCCEGTLPQRKSKRGIASPARDLKVLETAERIRQTRSDIKCDNSRCETVVAIVSRVKQPDASPDSAIVADYESKRRNPVCSPFHEQILQTALDGFSDKRTFANSMSNFLKLSSSFSLNDIFKSDERNEVEANRKTFLGRLRGSQGSLSSNNYRYSPLHAGDENYSDTGDALGMPRGDCQRNGNNSAILVDDITGSSTPCWLSPGVLRKHTERLSRIEAYDDAAAEYSDVSVNAHSDTQSNDRLSELSRLNGESSEVESIL